MNEILYQESKKLKALTTFASDFHSMYDLQEKELKNLQETCLVERVAVSGLKAGSTKYSGVLFKSSELKY